MSNRSYSHRGLSVGYCRLSENVKHVAAIYQGSCPSRHRRRGIVWLDSSCPDDGRGIVTNDQRLQ